MRQRIDIKNWGGTKLVAKKMRTIVTTVTKVKMTFLLNLSAAYPPSKEPIIVRILAGKAKKVPIVALSAVVTKSVYTASSVKTKI